ncbi:disease resistance protein, partial [Trifolium medium]|nr:disease resistance protein [Trifolium medium]
IVSGEFVDFFQSTKLDTELLDKLKVTLVSLKAVLNDAAEKQITNPAVKQWLNMLLDGVFEADALFDEINTEALRCKVEANQNLGLKSGVSNNFWNVTPTSSVVGDESAISGRDDDRKKLKEFLLSEDGSGGDGRKIGVISIVGMGGLGKTTLAKLLYNDPEVKEKFEVRGWAHVSKDLDVVAVTKTLLESVTSETITASDSNKLQVQLQQRLSNKKFLLVLDDMWHGRYVGWNSMNDIFNVGKMGSKIIITTRDERVLLPMQTFYVHRLRSLEPEDCWSLLARHAFVASNNQQRSNLEEIGREIAKKCDGLPLTAVALGGLLRTNLSEYYWNDVLKSSIWDLTKLEKA